MTELPELMGMVVLASIVGGVLHLDRTAAFQFLISRPLVSSVVTGLLFGDAATGLLIGMVLELLWLGIQPLGTVLPPDDTIVAVAATAGAIATGRLFGTSGAAPMGFSVLVALPLSAAGRIVDIEIRRLNGFFLRRARRAARAGDVGGVQRQHILGIVSFFSFFSLFSLAGILVVILAVLLIYPLLPERIMGAFGWIFWSLPFFGAGAMVGREGKELRFGAIYLLSYGLLFLVARMW
jgi:PTS system mannose-specific IIC component